MKGTGIYMWTSPSGKSYIGQAQDLYSRKKDFLLDPCNHNYTSNNSKIDKARRKYTNFNEWKYTIIEYCSIDELNEREKFYINYYDTFNNGYNCTEGGDGVRGYRFNDEQRQHISNQIKGNKHPNYGKHTTNEVLQKLKDANKENSIPIEQYTLEGEYITEYPSIREAARQVNCNHSNIKKALKGTYKSCGGFKWKYKEV